MSVALELLAYHGRPCPYCSVVMRLPASKNSRKSWGRKHSRYPDSPTRDHVIPKSRMPGMGTLIVCFRCNSDKRDMTISEWANALDASSDPRAPTVRAWMKENLGKALQKSVPAASTRAAPRIEARRAKMRSSFVGDESLMTEGQAPK